MSKTLRRPSISVVLAILFLVSCKKEQTPTLKDGWELITVPNAQNIIDIEITDAMKGYLITNSKLMKSTDGGYAWSEVQLDSKFIGYNFSTIGAEVYMVNFNRLSVIRNDKLFDTLKFKENLHDIQMINTETGYLVSCNGIYKTSDRGTSWTRQFKTTDTTCSRYSALFFRSPEVGWFGLGDSLYRTTNGGSVYEKVKVAENITTWYNISSPNDKTVYMVNNKGVFKSLDGGRTVTRLKTAPGWGKFTEVYFEDENNGYMIGGNAIARTQDGGDSWANEVELNFPEEFIEFDFLDSRNAWACTTFGRIAKLSR